MKLRRLIGKDPIEALDSDKNNLADSTASSREVALDTDPPSSSHNKSANRPFFSRLTSRLSISPANYPEQTNKKSNNSSTLRRCLSDEPPKSETSHIALVHRDAPAPDPHQIAPKPRSSKSQSQPISPVKRVKLMEWEKHKSAPVDSEKEDFGMLRTRSQPDLTPSQSTARSSTNASLSLKDLFVNKFDAFITSVTTPPAQPFTETTSESADQPPQDSTAQISQDDYDSPIKNTNRQSWFSLPGLETLTSPRGNKPTSPKNKKTYTVHSHTGHAGTVTTISGSIIAQLTDFTSSLFQSTLQEIIGPLLYQEVKEKYARSISTPTPSLKQKTQKKAVSNTPALPDTLIEIKLDHSRIQTTLRPLCKIMECKLKLAKADAKQGRATLSLENATQTVIPIMLVYFRQEIRHIDLNSYDLNRNGKISFIMPEEADIESPRVNRNGEKLSTNEIHFIEEITDKLIPLIDNKSPSSDVANSVVCILLSTNFYFSKLFRTSDAYNRLSDLLKNDPQAALDEIELLAAEAMSTEEMAENIIIKSPSLTIDDNDSNNELPAITLTQVPSPNNHDSFFKAVGHQLHPPVSAITFRKDFAARLQALGESQIKDIIQSTNCLLEKAGTSLRIEDIDQHFIERVETSVKEVRERQANKYCGDIRHAIVFAFIYNWNVVIFTSSGTAISLIHNKSSSAPNLEYIEGISSAELRPNTIYLNFTETGIVHAGFPVC